MNKLFGFLNKVQDEVAGLLVTKPLAVFSILAFIFVILRLYFPIEPLLLVVFIIGVGLIFLNLKDKIDIFITVFLCVAMLLGVFSATIKLFSVQGLHDTLSNQEVRITGNVVSIPDMGKYNTTFLFDCDRIYSHVGEFEDVKIYVKVGINHSLKYGDRLVFNARLKAPEKANRRLANHYLSKGALLVADEVVLLEKMSGVGVYNITALVRNYILDIGDRFFKGDAKALFKALTAGDRTDFSDELSKNLSLSGLSHIACVSGLHVTILGMAVYNLFKKRNRILSAIPALVAVFAFAFITGASPSALRAAMMFTSFIIAKTTLRDSDSFTALSLSAAVLVLINPYSIYDWGFILSFLSVLGIQIFSLYFKTLLNFLPDNLSDSISVTISAQLMSMPAVINMFGYISTYSIFANIVISAVFLWVLYFCFIFIAVSSIPQVNIFIKEICSFGLYTIAAVANLFAELPHSSLGVESLDVIQIVVYYGIVMMFVFRKRLTTGFISVCLCLCTVILIISAMFPFEYTHKYIVADNSFILAKNEKTVLIAKDSLWEIDAFLEDENAVFDDLIITEAEKGEECALINMRRNIKTVHIPEEYKKSTVDLISNRLGCEIKYYSSKGNIDEYIKKILN